MTEGNPGADPVPPRRPRLEEPTPPPRLGLLDHLEEWIYRLNERDHWIFRSYDFANEVAAVALFRRTRAAARALRTEFGGAGAAASLRLLRPEDTESFSSFLASLGTRYLPPHRLDSRTAARVLRRRSHLPFGIFVEGRLQGYVLARFFLPGRVVAGIWILPAIHGRRYGRDGWWAVVEFLHRQGWPLYCTIPRGNTPSIRTALAAGFDFVRTNRRFHVLRVDPRRLEAQARTRSPARASPPPEAASGGSSIRGRR